MFVDASKLQVPFANPGRFTGRFSPRNKAALNPLEFEYRYGPALGREEYRSKSSVCARWTLKCVLIWRY